MHHSKTSISAASLTSLVLLHWALFSHSYWVEASTDANIWHLMKDDPLEYSMRTSFPAVDKFNCLTEAGLSGEEVEAVTFDEGERVCHLFDCVWGNSGCRKCRTANNEAGKMFWVKQLLHQERRICWRTFQHRVDDSVLFNRSWLEYQVGFGQDEQRNFWMGLDALHEGTKDGLRRVRWELNLWTGEPYWAENEHFVVAGADDKYHLDLGPLDVGRSTLGMCALDSSASPHNKSFTTYDQDNDVHPTKNCAESYPSGWWHGRCICFNPNGVYVNGPTAYSLNRTGPALCYTWESSTNPFIFKYSMMRFECLFADFI